MRSFASLAPLLLLAIPQWSMAQSARVASVDTKQSAIAAFDEGQNAHQRGDLNSAVRFYTNAVSLDPSMYQAYYQRGVALAGLGRDKEAEADFTKVSELEPKFPRAHRALGQIFLDRGQSERAIGEFARAIELEPKLPGVRVFYASALLRSGDPNRAIEHLKAAIDQKEDLPLAYALLGLAEERVGRIPDALADYSRAIALEPSNAIAHEGRARIFEGRGETASAIEEYTEAYKTQPSREAAIRLAALHTKAGQPQAAIQLYRRLLLEKPDDFAVRAEMACVMAENDQAEEAEKEITRVLTARPNDATLLAKFGDLFYQSKPAVAAGYYKRAVEADPNDLRARTQLGASLVRSLQIDAAVQVLTDLIARDPRNYPAHASLATALFKQKQYLPAAREFIWLINSKPEVAASYYFLAISLDHLGDCEQALRSYQEFARRADASANKNEIEEANARSGQLQRLIKERKCQSPPKGKKR